MKTSRNAVARLSCLLLTTIFLTWVTNTWAQTHTNQTRVDVNSADVATLRTLPGIGPTLAQRIIDGRPYRSPADLETVKGLSQPKIAAFKDQILFGPSTGVKTAAPNKPVTAAEAKTVPGTNVVAARQPDAKPQKAVQTNRAPAAPETAPAPVQGKGAQPGLTKSASRASSKLAPGQTVNINKAAFKELDALPGIGPTKAQAIIDYRTQKGPFKTIEDIQNVKGIKAESFSKIKDHIKVTD